MATIAVFGLNGLLGKPIIEGLLREPFISKIKAPIRLLTSSDKRPVESSKVEYINIKEAGVDKPLDGVDVVINLGAIPGAPKEDALLQSVIAHKIKLYIPSEFGTDLKRAHNVFNNFLSPKTIHSEAAREGGVKTVDVCTGLLINPDSFLPFAPLYLFGKDVEQTKKVTIAGDENTLLNPSFVQDVGSTVAALATREDYLSIPDTIRVYSDRVLVADLIKHYEKVHDVKMDISYVPAADALKEAQERYSQGFKQEDFTFYLRTILSLGENKGLIHEQENEREFVNPNESLFKWTKYQI